MNGAEAFPYPDDDPETIRGFGKALADCSAGLADEIAKVRSGRTSITTVWVSEAGMRAAAEVDAVATLGDEAVLALAETPGHLEDYAIALDTARTTIDWLRSAYDTAQTDYDATMAATPDGPGVAGLSYELENALNSELSELRVQYDDALADVDSVAVTAGAALVEIGARISPSPLSDNGDLAAGVVLDRLPFMTDHSRTTVTRTGERTIIDTPNSDDQVMVRRDSDTGEVIVNVNGIDYRLSPEEAADLVIRTNGGSDAVHSLGGDTDVTLLTGAGDDLLLGGDGNDVVLPGTGADQMVTVDRRGEGGNNTLDTSDAADTVSERPAGLVDPQMLNLLLPGAYQFGGINNNDPKRQFNDVGPDTDADGKPDGFESEYNLPDIPLLPDDAAPSLTKAEEIYWDESAANKLAYPGWERVANRVRSDVPHDIGQDASQINALLHITTAAELARSYGVGEARGAMERHENIIDGEAIGTLDDGRKMDLINNEVGFRIAQQVEAEFMSGQFPGSSHPDGGEIRRRIRELALEAVEQQQGAVWLKEVPWTYGGFNRAEYLQG